MRCFSKSRAALTSRRRAVGHDDDRPPTRSSRFQVFFLFFRHALAGEMQVRSSCAPVLSSCSRKHALYVAIVYGRVGVERTRRFEPTKPTTNRDEEPTEPTHPAGAAGSIEPAALPSAANRPYSPCRNVDPLRPIDDID